eukprot:916174-Prorocentrum_minimum.AAC.1
MKHGVGGIFREVANGSSHTHPRGGGSQERRRRLSAGAQQGSYEACDFVAAGRDFVAVGRDFVAV